MVSDSHKTLEGSTAAYLAQLAAVLIIHRIGEFVCRTELSRLMLPLEKFFATLSLFLLASSTGQRR